jgi:hypothetical protein
VGPPRQSPYPLLPHLFPSAAPHRITSRRAALARVGDGTVSPPAGTHVEPRVALVSQHWEFPRGKRPQYPHGYARGTVASIAKALHRIPRLASQPGRATESLPSGRFDPTSTSRDRAPAGLPPTTWVFPLSSIPQSRGETRGRRGRWRRGWRARGHRAAPGRPEAVRGPGPPGRELPGCGGGSCACPREPEPRERRRREHLQRRRERLHRASNDYTADPM